MNPNSIAKALLAGLGAGYAAFQAVASHGPITANGWAYIAGAALVTFGVVWGVPNVPTPVAKVLPELLGVAPVTARAAAAAAFGADLVAANAPVIAAVWPPAVTPVPVDGAPVAPGAP
jgi:hypothetical protein